MNYRSEEVLGFKAGDVISIGGKRHLILKKGSTAISVRRWYWWDELFKQLFGGE